MSAAAVIPRAGRVPIALTIAGSDSGGGAGIQADLKTFQELGVFGTSAITGLTAQNSVGVHGIWPAPVSSVEAQIEAVLSDIGTDAVKTGMLCSVEIVKLTARLLRKYRSSHIVVDPVTLSKHGSALLEGDAVSAMCTELLPLAELVTPNIPEACLLLGWQESDIRSVSAMTEAARSLLQYGPRHVLLKGGHLDDQAANETAIDVLVSQEDPSRHLLFSAPRIATVHTHGTGCTTASAITAFLALGMQMEEAVGSAKRFTHQAISSAVPLGAGIGSLWHAAHRTL
ncbi:bifunctional hydroxymethylpyrimidine kinase/phosphomethylpyrimidine kinase [Paenibacillus beijingensis]|uniref:Hydroxymethylpyrimidine/phosphomethylpyrimidine kinase n=1 Tax=Paenibacillus beijingensis TaxID=1126833 RepID=A0A0D5NF73_9BACL|nr:bifunctional hydroxymethylpyrimidine kinase/phosphomethylpyrimidine kinase [Paenibacillus beijingensis]AJY73607.1 phosphomethylpyrimidine kinase [Paenibacillus beijingensis]